MKKILILTISIATLALMVFTGTQLIEEPKTDLSDEGKTTQHDLVFEDFTHLRSSYWEVDGLLENRQFGAIDSIEDADSWTGNGTYYANSYKIDPDAGPTTVRTPIGRVEVSGFNVNETYEGSFLLREGEILKRDLILPEGEYSFITKIKHANIINQDVDCEESRVTVSSEMTSEELLISNHDDWQYQEIENFHTRDNTGETHFKIRNNLGNSENCGDPSVLAIKEIYLEKD